MPWRQGICMSYLFTCPCLLLCQYQLHDFCREHSTEGAIVAGVLLCLVPQSTAMLQRAGMIAPDGRCKTMDAAADGYVRAETCKAMYLKPADMQGMTACFTVHPISWHSQKAWQLVEWQPLLTQPAFTMLLFPLGTPKHNLPAVFCSTHKLYLHPPWLPITCVGIAGMNNDAPALGIILSSAVNTNGRSSALTAPHGPSQQGLLRAALQSAGLQPWHVAALQMHSNGTPLGDPIEVGAAAAVLLQVGFICNSS